jgi:hypothetical protein
MHNKHFVAAAGALVTVGAAILPIGPAPAQQGPAGCAWNKYLYAQDATKQGNIDTNLLNQMSGMAATQGYSLTDKVWQLCSGWLMTGKRKDGSTAILYVEPKSQTIVDVDFTK